MPYNPYFSQSYNPYPIQYPQTMPQNVAQSTPQNRGGLIWVQGLEGAKSFTVAPGESALLMDSEHNTFYIKSADVSGMPLPLRVFDYTERAAQSAPQLATANAAPDYITRAEFETRIAEIMPKSKPEGVEKDAE